LYDDTLPEQGRNFANKIWNAFRLVKSWKADENLAQPESSKAAAKWMTEVLKKVTAEIDSNFRKFRISEALMNVYRLFWNEFSGWYLEIIKPVYQKPIDKKTLEETISFFDNLLRLIHPFMPFISEEIWQMLYERKDGESLMISRMPELKKSSKDLLGRFEIAKETISTIRTIRKEKELPTKEKLMLYIRSDENSFDKKFLPVIIKLGNLSGVKFVAKKQKGAASFMVRTTEFFIPLGDKLDVKSELKKIREELDYYKGFLTSVMKKLDNERFIKNAPESVLDLERKKKSDAEAKIKALEEAIKALRT
jgi:valyl-tRNA synthetase